MQVFESLLVDCDAAVNYANWNYFAGVGNDPRNRAFKTVTQGETYDADGALIATWLPALARLPPHLRHRPWLRHGSAQERDMNETRSAAEHDQHGAKAGLGNDGNAHDGKVDYPEPIVDVATQIGMGPRKTSKM